VGHWCHRFILDSAGLAQVDLLTEHTFFQVAIDGLAINLMTPPWDASRTV